MPRNVGGSLSGGGGGPMETASVHLDGPAPSVAQSQFAMGQGGGGGGMSPPGGGDSFLPPTTKPMAPELGQPIISSEPPLSKIMKAGPMGQSIKDIGDAIGKKTGMYIEKPAIGNLDQGFAESGKLTAPSVSMGGGFIKPSGQGRG